MNEVLKITAEVIGHAIEAKVPSAAELNILAEKSVQHSESRVL